MGFGSFGCAARGGIRELEEKSKDVTGLEFRVLFCSSRSYSLIRVLRLSLLPARIPSSMRSPNAGRLDNRSIADRWPRSCRILMLGILCVRMCIGTISYVYTSVICQSKGCVCMYVCK